MTQPRQTRTRQHHFCRDRKDRLGRDRRPRFLRAHAVSDGSSLRPFSSVSSTVGRSEGASSRVEVMGRIATDRPQLGKLVQLDNKRRAGFAISTLKCHRDQITALQVHASRSAAAAPMKPSRSAPSAVPPHAGRHGAFACGLKQVLALSALRVDALLRVACHQVFQV